MPTTPRTCEGPSCENVLPPIRRGGGGRRRFCSDSCRSGAARARAASLTEKKCGACKTVKPIAEFHAAYRGYCRDCELAKQRDRYQEGRPYLGKDRSYEKSLQRLYGLTLAEYEAMATAQGGLCAICGEVPEQRLNVDHDHITGAIRELLCGLCNTAIAGARDNPGLLRAMIAYLERHKEAAA